MTEPASARWSSLATAWAMPKSVTFTWPSRVIKMLPGFTSRCTTPVRCAYPSAAATWAAICAARAGDSVVVLRRRSASEVPSTSSITMKYVPASSPQSKTGTILGCERLAAAWASRRKRSTNRGSALNSG